ncbi:MAG TPA: response regulator transcription factor [Bacillota bacterium]|nr:response regulator transcription factor [Bacillota bacterium]
MNKQLIAVVDDDDNIRQLVEAYLQKEGFQTAGLGSAEDAWVFWKNTPPDLWVLDIMLPGMNGYEFCRKIRAEAEVPIIIISARDEEVDKILGLELGSDDYLTKPFSPRELVARVKRILNRWTTYQKGIGKDHDHQIHLGQLLLITEERRVCWEDQEVEVTAKEFVMLHTLATSPNRAFAREELLSLVWGSDYFGSDRAVDDLIKRLRKKMVGLPIETVWGYGYRLRKEEEENV